MIVGCSLSVDCPTSTLYLILDTAKYTQRQKLSTTNCADPRVPKLISARSHTFVEIDHEIISTVILLFSAVSFKKGCCQLQVKVGARSTG